LALGDPRFKHFQEACSMAEGKIKKLTDKGSSTRVTAAHVLPHVERRKHPSRVSTGVGWRIRVAPVDDHAAPRVADDPYDATIQQCFPLPGLTAFRASGNTLGL
jgi:hypothetical protein